MVLSAFCQFFKGSSKQKPKVWQEGPWYSWSEALKKAKEEKKPIMVLIYHPSCKGCDVFKEQFSSSLKVQELSSEFVLADILSDNAIQKFCPDGQYVPRVFFTDYNGNLLKIVNELGNPKRLYHYPTMKSLLVSMAEALVEHKKITKK